MKQYFIYFDRSQKLDGFFIISEVPLFRQDPILITENKEEAESICSRLNDVLKSQIQTMMDDKDFFFKVKSLPAGQLNTPDGIFDIKIIKKIANITVFPQKRKAFGPVYICVTNIDNLYYSPKSKDYIYFERKNEAKTAQ